MVRSSGLTLCLSLAFLVSAGSPTRAQTYQVLYSFRLGTDGCGPASTLVRDPSGNLYGTTKSGGTQGLGTVFELAADGTETVLHSFAGSPNDGAQPWNNALLRDPSGDLFGTTPFGGNSGYNSGVLYELNAEGTETVLYNFAAIVGNAGFPYGGILADSEKNLYGTSQFGGVDDSVNGTVWRFAQDGTFSLLYAFGLLSGGENPISGLLRDPSGNLYGATEGGGTSGDGTVFELSPTGEEHALLNFTAYSGIQPTDTLTRDSDGTLFGTASADGPDHSHGTVFALEPSGRALVLHSFGDFSGGVVPLGGVVQGSAGTLYGTAGYGGTDSCKGGCGVLFELSAAGQESRLHIFSGPPADGQLPEGGLTLDDRGNLYGTTAAGGAYGCGIVFQYTP